MNYVSDNKPQQDGNQHPLLYFFSKISVFWIIQRFEKEIPRRQKKAAPD
jgi:hypothetical protein